MDESDDPIEPEESNAPAPPIRDAVVLIKYQDPALDVFEILSGTP